MKFLILKLLMSFLSLAQGQTGGKGAEPAAPSDSGEGAGPAAPSGGKGAEPAAPSDSGKGAAPAAPSGGKGAELPFADGDHNNNHHWTCIGLHKHDWSRLCRLQGNPDNGDTQWLPWGYISQNYQYAHGSSFHPDSNKMMDEMSSGLVTHYAEGEESEQAEALLDQLQSEIYKVIHMSESDTVDPRIWHNKQYSPPSEEEIGDQWEEFTDQFRAINRKADSLQCAHTVKCCVDKSYINPQGESCCKKEELGDQWDDELFNCHESFVYATRGHGPNVLSENCHTTIVQRETRGSIVMVTKSRAECVHY